MPASVCRFHGRLLVYALILSLLASCTPSHERPAVTPIPTTALPISQGSTNAPIPRVEGAHLVNAVSEKELRLVGFDVPGTESACVLDQGFGLGPMNEAEAQAIAAKHANVVRVPLNEDCWLGINGMPESYAGAAYQTAIANWVRLLNHVGLAVVLDLHWSAPGTTKATGQWPMPDADHSVLFWSQVASTFRSDPSVIFDLFNEPDAGRQNPTSADWECWRNGCTGTFQKCTSQQTPTASASGLATSGTPGPKCIAVTYKAAGMQQLLDAVRSAGAEQAVMVAPLANASDFCGMQSAIEGSAQECPWLLWMPSDPDQQVIASFHVYPSVPCSTESCWNASVATVASQVPVITGEMGEMDCTATFVQSYMSWADEHDISYLGWAWDPGRAGVDAAAEACSTHLVSTFLGAPGTPAGRAMFENLQALYQRFGPTLN